LRNQETDDYAYGDISTSSGSRNYRLNELLNQRYYGKISISIAKKVLADHFDVFSNKEVMNSRCICKHAEVDSHGKKPNYPFGSTDAKVTNSAMVKEMKFLAKFGSSCDREFYVDRFVEENPKYKKWSDFLIDMPNHYYVEIQRQSSLIPEWVSMYLPRSFFGGNIFPVDEYDYKNLTNAGLIGELL
jgi:hypothetical protein